MPKFMGGIQYNIISAVYSLPTAYYVTEKAVA